MTEWFFIGLFLGIPSEEMLKCTTRKDIIHKWLEMGQESCSWQKLVEALVGAKQSEIAGNIAAKCGDC